MLTLQGASFGASALAALRSPAQSALGTIALWAALASILSKEWLFHITHAVGMRHQLSTLVANAYHHRSDAMSSCAAVLGIGGSLAGFACVDALAALTVGGMVLKLGVETAIDAC